MTDFDTDFARREAAWDTAGYSRRAEIRKAYASKGWSMCTHPNCPPWSCRAAASAPVPVTAVRDGIPSLLGSFELQRSKSPMALFAVDQPLVDDLVRLAFWLMMQCPTDRMLDVPPALETMFARVMTSCSFEEPTPARPEG